MPGMTCAVAVCRNSFYKTRNNPIKKQVNYFSFPKNSELRKLWVVACRRKDKFNPDTSFVCSNHFDPSDFQKSMIAELGFAKHRKRLKPGACPTKGLCPKREDVKIEEDLSDEQMDRSPTFKAQTISQPGKESHHQDSVYCGPSFLTPKFEFESSSLEDSYHPLPLILGHELHEISNMPVNCAVATCGNNGYKTRHLSGPNTVSYFTFPKERQLRQIWIHFCKRKDKFNPDTSAICSQHFKGSDFERNLRAELLQMRQKKILKPGAVPTLNKVNLIDKDDTDISTKISLGKERMSLPAVTSVYHPDTKNQLKTRKYKSVYHRNREKQSVLEYDDSTDEVEVSAAVKSEVVLKEALSTGLRLKEWINDDCQVFGNFVASELRSITNDGIRKELKQFIQRGILEFLEKDASSLTNSPASLPSISSSFDSKSSNFSFKFSVDSAITVKNS